MGFWKKRKPAEPQISDADYAEFSAAFDDDEPLALKDVMERLDDLGDRLDDLSEQNSKIYTGVCFVFGGLCLAAMYYWLYIAR